MRFNTLSVLNRICSISNKELIYNHMKENNLTKKQFCERCGICMRTLNKFLEDREMHYNIKSLLKLARYLQIPIAKLFMVIEETEEQSPSV